MTPKEIAHQILDEHPDVAYYFSTDTPTTDDYQRAEKVVAELVAQTTTDYQEGYEAALLEYRAAIHELKDSIVPA